MRGECCACGCDLVYVRVEVALGGGQGAVAGDPSQDIDLDSRVGEPGQSGVPEVVAAQVLVAEFGDHVVPVGGVAQDGGGDASAARAGEEAGIGIGACGQDALGDEGADFLDDGNLAGALALGALVGQSCSCRKCHPCSSGCMFVFVEDAAEPVASSDVEVVDLPRICGWYRRWLEGTGVRDALVRSVGVVVLLELP